MPESGTRTTPPDPNIERLARQFHESYERLAPSFGYETRRESAVPWDQVPEQNRALMVTVVGEVLAAMSADLEAERRKAEAYKQGGADACRDLQARIDALSESLASTSEALEAARAALREATTIARHLHGMIDRETWREQGAEWMGQYEGDHWAEQARADIERLAALAAPDPEGDQDTCSGSYADSSARSTTADAGSGSDTSGGAASAATRHTATTSTRATDPDPEGDARG